jgi:hypothetical protein
MIEFRIGRFACRWRLGAALQKVERVQGRRSDLAANAAKSFRTICADLNIDTSDATEAQRIACLPAKELEAFCARWAARCGAAASAADTKDRQHDEQSDDDDQHAPAAAGLRLRLDSACGQSAVAGGPADDEAEGEIDQPVHGQ